MFSNKLIVLTTLAALLAGCAKGTHSKEQAPQAAPVSVTTETLAESEVPGVRQASGTVEARVTTPVSARVMGYVREIRVQTGDQVRADQVVAVIDSRDLESSVQLANAALNEARAAMAEVQQGINAASAQLELAKSTFARMSSLFEKKSISNQEFDEASARLKMAQTGYDAAVSKQAQVSAKVEQARQGVRAAEIARTYAEVRAPFAGIVKERKAEPGSMAVPGSPLLIIEQAAGYRFQAPVEESMLATLKVGQAATVHIDALDKTLPLRISEIVPTVDPSSRSVTVKVALPAIQGIRSGLSGRLEIAAASQKALTIPSDAVVNQGSVQTVFVADNGFAHSRMVSLGRKLGDRTEVLAGLRAGDRVIHPRPADLTDGASIEAK
jgi:multidrug efflux system membrane fusion protein